MSSFRRAQLRGSDELFQTTKRAEQGQLDVVSMPNPEHAAAVVEQLGQHGAVRALRLSVEELETLADALQRMKFPGATARGVSRPSVEEFERLEELRHKLLSALHG